MNTEQQTEDLTPIGDDDGWRPLDIVLALGAFVAIVAIAIGGYFYYESTRPAPVTDGSAAPAFSLPRLNGPSVSLADYRGKVVMINIWASWCNSCRQEMPSMEKFYESMKGKPFEILAVSIDAQKNDADQFARQLGLTFPILLDPGKNVYDLYQATGQPETFIIDKQGKVAKHIIGPDTWTDASSPNVALIQQLVSN